MSIKDYQGIKREMRFTKGTLRRQKDGENCSQKEKKSENMENQKNENECREGEGRREGEMKGSSASLQVVALLLTWEANVGLHAVQPLTYSSLPPSPSPPSHRHPHSFNTPSFIHTPFLFPSLLSSPFNSPFLPVLFFPILLPSLQSQAPSPFPHFSQPSPLVFTCTLGNITAKVDQSPVKAGNVRGIHQVK